MGLVAVISRAPHITIDEWLKVVASRSELVHREPSTIVNPFTRKKQVHTPRPSEADLRLDGVIVGAIEPGSEFDEDGELHVFSPTEEVSEEGKRVLGEIAAQMSATIEWIP